MKKIGVSLVIIAGLIFVFAPFYALFSNAEPVEDNIIAAFLLGIIGSIMILISVAKDRYEEYKEDKENNDYRKY
ncbi:hypothetical protein BHF71_07620 [Vulcanibacillus modesticaldus]|uniref:Uncharacterized protein n=1 Tax=Vulcanibacillus modesticaldus TaxID=337097 RepID=A0A1D2YVK1_9BACI|nr:hypothetical protein [Vulcanibacillus modesticaldus]OEF99750.1 hypothetical protein BHF71_07620 [Vulcanibacillus modesticaldus]